ncbi:MAG: hypothetical protein LBQ77_08645 [Treponema sp.]|jgi:hypothetical protein|nr:hypothetical protein [Treponema sp.]
MLSREDFIWTIGYEGSAAIIDGQAKRHYGTLSTKELAEKGLFRAAYASALYAQDKHELETVAAMYNNSAGTSYVIDGQLDRLFGVFLIEAKHTIIL